MNDRSRSRGPLDPRTDPERWETRVRSITRAARPELDALAAASPPLPVLALARWFRPLVTGTAVVAAAAAASLLAVRTAPEAPPGWGVAEVIAPEPVAVWLVAGVVPNAEELVLALEEAR